MSVTPISVFATHSCEQKICHTGMKFVMKLSIVSFSSVEYEDWAELSLVVKWKAVSVRWPCNSPISFMR